MTVTAPVLSVPLIPRRRALLRSQLDTARTKWPEDTPRQDWVERQPEPQSVGYCQHPLPGRDVRQDAVHQVRRRVRHPSTDARWAEAAPFAGEPDQPTLATFLAPHPQKAMGQDSAAQVCLDLFDDEPGERRSVAPGVQVGEERAPVVLQDAIEKRLFGTASNVVRDPTRMVVGSNRGVCRCSGGHCDSSVRDSHCFCRPNSGRSAAMACGLRPSRPFRR